ncbi:MAG TPA: hypothetical protein VFM25_00350 [Verrucomicrobiae bacterium]|nr:hypothetical protein [Verrucomicrobiae bacterium]
MRTRSLSRVTIPEIPSLSTNSTAHVEKKNGPVATLAKTHKPETNAPNHAVAGRETNSVALVSATKTNSQVSVSSAKSNTNTPVAESPKINSPALLASAETKTNLARPAVLTIETNIGGATESQVQSTNIIAATLEKNSGAHLETNKLPHPPAILASANSHSPPPMMAMHGMPGMPGKLPDLPMDVKARVDRIVDSEILGPVIHPMPMALLGIAGNFAFLRAPSGQTDLVKEGDSLGSIKLLRIGINRVLVEENGEKKELTIFSGFGGESLLTKEGNTNDTTQK